MFKIFLLIWGVVISFFFLVAWGDVVFFQNAKRNKKYKDRIIFMIGFLLFPIPLVYCICELITIFRGY